MKLVEGESQKLKIFLNIFVLAVAFYGLSRKSPDFTRTSAFENVMIDSFAPLQRSITYIHGQVSSFFKHYLFNVDASQNNIQLKKKLSELEGQIFSYEELAKENLRLKELLEFGKEIPRKKVLAQIVAWDSSSDFKVIRVNKGIKHGIKLQSTVVTSEGLVGYIYRLTDHFADVMTIMDPNNRVDAILKRTRSHGIVEGSNSSKVIMKYVTRTEPIILNDEVLTSGLGNIYPKSVRIGHVTRIERESYGVTQEVTITPLVDFSRLEEVVILVNSSDRVKKLEWEALDKPEEGGSK